MFFYFIVLFIIALFLVVINPKNESNRWASAFLLFASLGGLADTIRALILPSLLRENFSNLYYLFNTIQHILDFINQTLTPYGVLIFAIVYSEFFNKKWRSLLKIVLLLPVIIMLFTTTYFPILKLNYLLLLYWVAPYYILSCFLLTFTFVTEKHPLKRKNKLITFFIIVPTILSILFFINIMRVYDPNFYFFPYVSVFIIFSLVTALFFSFRYGVLGMKVNIEKDHLNTTIKSVSSGTAILNHTLKNEIGKITLTTENLKKSLEVTNQDIDVYFNIINRASNHMQEMVDRIQDQMKDIQFKETTNGLDELIVECLENLKSDLEKKKIQINLSLIENINLFCDRTHIQEVFNNILKNAIESMPIGGSLSVVTYKTRKHIVVSIKDNGKGISSKNLKYVLDPFFTTKNKKQNYGLGLSYCYNVMQQCGGSIELYSEENMGTEVKLFFPNKMMV
ncbi:sensor histidine kinase [Chengkuizengella sediminis]|uniref:sensor histidine kinase n=1 Tax=Chengkuizengella sediminis TaxID=1885917 RepID=UPI001389B45A|nr:HAMP domain-containing sensor histidine kinase [Chengkuizengella sediminis]NDI34116.1 GHKL domain-containing protein [Chengkuizengella sediminis]